MSTPTRPSGFSDMLGGVSTWPSLDAILQGPHELPRWIGWRFRLLVGWVLLGCALLLMIVNWLISQPKLPMTLRGTPDGHVRVHSVDYPTLQHLEGRYLIGIQAHADAPESAASGPAASAIGPIPTPAPDAAALKPHVAPISLLVLQKSARWISEHAQRLQFMAMHQDLANLMLTWNSASAMTVDLRFDNGTTAPVLLAPRGLMGISPLFWLLSAVALMVFAVGAVVVLAGPQWRNLAFALMALCHSVQLMLIATSTSLDVFAPIAFLEGDLHVRIICDLCVAATIVAVAALHPRRIENWPAVITLTALVLFVLIAAFNWIDAPWTWWGLIISCLAMGLAAMALMSAACRMAPHPFTLVMRRFTAITLGSWALLSVAVASGMGRPDMQLNIATYGVMTWEVFAASQLLLSPYLSRSKLILQEFSLLAASSTVAASLDLLFVAIFSLGQFTSMTLSLFLSFGVYLSIRRWVMTKLPGKDSLTMERLFQSLYRIAREVERQPDALTGLLMQLVRDLFDPLEITLVHGMVSQSLLKGNGSVLLIPLPVQDPSPHSQVLVLKHAKKGQRLFTAEDARLADRIIEQLHRALNFDRAVEQGRSEERMRIAQDLHDDIGARLLTLMYQAPSAEMEEYIRHTLQDLKTLTRGLAAQSHALTEAAGEWKRDLSQRLAVSRCELDWQLRVDVDVVLNMVQWSALTRILRELVNNTISHAKATKVSISVVLELDKLTLTVADNGQGGDPTQWTHGLGLGGVRKRVKQLGGSVRWMTLEPRGICCEVVVEPFSASSGVGAEMPAQVSH